MISISANQLAQRPKKIGTLRGHNVMALSTKGGFHMIVSPKDGGYETLGTGPHPCVARHLAMAREPDVQWTELSKADHVDFEDYAPLLPKYEAITERLRKLNGDK